MKASIIIIFNEIRKELFPLLKEIREQIDETRDFEIVLVHESNKRLRPLSEFKGAKYINIPEARGFAYNRNKGLEQSSGDIIIFIDDDCYPARGWLRNLVKPFANQTISAVMGNVKVKKSGYLGDCISELGFPAGANAGFNRIWRVDKKGLTNHLSTCNSAIRRHVFGQIGRFNERLVYGAEDAELSHRMVKAGLLIKYNPDALAYHKPRKDLASFIRWQLRRGRANFYFRQEVGDIGDFMRLRLWSSWNIIKKNISSMKIFGVAFLLFLSFFLQQIGYLSEKTK